MFLRRKVLLISFVCTALVSGYGSDIASGGETPENGSVKPQATSVQQALTSTPNLVFVLVDDQSAYSVGAYARHLGRGTTLARTPNIDQLARDGVLFANAFVTNSLCTPSRATILTGKYSHRNNVRDNNDPIGTQTGIPQLLRSRGYQTALVGKWHLQTEPPPGFTYWHILRGQGSYTNPTLYGPGTQKVTYSGNVTTVVKDKSIDWLRNRNRSIPFALFVHHKAPHDPYIPPSSYNSRFTADQPEPPTFNDDYANRASAARNATITLADSNLTYQGYIKPYLRCIAAVDDTVKALRDFLVSDGSASNTVFIYASDNGYFMGDHGWLNKRFMYEESIRVPLIVYYPGIPSPRRVNRKMVLNVDIAPTILDLAGIAIPSSMQGRSLWPLIKNQAVSGWRTDFYYRYYDAGPNVNVARHFGIRTQAGMKLINYHELGEWELFDLTRDPFELRSVYDDPSYATQRATLRNRLVALQTQLGDRP